VPFAFFCANFFVDFLILLMLLTTCCCQLLLPVLPQGSVAGDCCLSVAAAQTLKKCRVGCRSPEKRTRDVLKAELL
jgi:hypothetical protein